LDKRKKWITNNTDNKTNKKKVHFLLTDSLGMRLKEINPNEERIVNVLGGSNCIVGRKVRIKHTLMWIVMEIFY
jgi:hypothetical protein